MKSNLTPNSVRVIRLSAIMIGLVLAIGCAGPSSKEDKQEDIASTGAKPTNADLHESIENQAQSERFAKEKLQQRDAQQKRSESAAQLSHFSSSDAVSTISTASFPAQPRRLAYEQAYAPPLSSENYQNIIENGIKQVALDPVSTFSIDVDTGSYTNTRRMLNQGYLPPADAVRIEEFVNYFDYDYPTPDSTDTPFSVNTALSVAPWNENRHLLRIGLKGYVPDQVMSNGSNLVFLLDVSGSMNQANKLPLLKRSLTMLTNQLSASDQVSIVVYAGASGVVLEPTQGNNKVAISEALNKLQAGGSTNGSAGIQQAYQLAEQGFIQGGVNRVILATDGDFNVGMVDQNALIDLIKRKKEKGIALTTLGFGQGNYNDYLMEQLADAGNGNYAYIDNINEARKVLVDELQSNMQIIAKDVKIQVEFNPETVAEYRLIGYENRKLAAEDFNNDKVDAGDIGAGHRVTALYEISLMNSASQYIDDLRYAHNKALTDKTNDKALTGELAQIKLRYKEPNENNSKLITKIVGVNQISAFAAQSTEFRFAAAVASYAQKLKLSKFSNELGYDWIAETAQEAKGKDEFGYRSEFIQLVRSTQQLADTN